RVEGNHPLESSDNPQFEPQPPSSAAPQSPEPAALDSFAPASFPAVPSAPPPVENPVWSGWDVLAVTGLMFVSIVVLQFGLVLAAQVLWYPHESFNQVAQKVAQRPITILVSTVLIYIPVALLMIVLIEGKYHVRFWQSIRWNWPRSEWKLLGLGAAMFFALALLEAYLPMPKDTPFDRLFD